MPHLRQRRVETHLPKAKRRWFQETRRKKAFIISSAHRTKRAKAEMSSDELVTARKSNARRGSKNGMAKLTEDEVRAIRQSQKMNKVIASDYRISPKTVTRIRKRELWSHLP
jgi:hypothetical protein